MPLQETLAQWMEPLGAWAIALSLLLNIALAVAGVLPSVVLTAANLLVFGFQKGLAISIAGESAGAAVSFLLYRIWFAQKAQPMLHAYPRVRQLLQAQGYRAAGLVFSLRLMPFVPSGLVTWAAAVGAMKWLPFVGASTLGKIPALLLEAMLVQGWLKSGWPWQVALTVVAAGALLLLATRQKKQSANENEPPPFP